MSDYVEAQQAAAIALLARIEAKSKESMAPSGLRDLAEAYALVAGNRPPGTLDNSGRSGRML